MTVSTPKITLPAPINSFIGRQDEIEGLRRLLSSGARLITLTGPGGVGKTRLALEFAAQNAEAFADGVFFVPLQALTEPEQVLPEVASVLHVTESGMRPLIEDLCISLADKRMLLCIDNWEHVLGAAPQLAGLLMACRRLHVLATSREALRLQGEQEYPVAPLGVPAQGTQYPRTVIQFEAVQLFVDRARAVKPGFEIDESRTVVIGEICALLDGLPLAIELAAALMRLFSPEALLTRLKSSPGLAGRSPSMQLLAGGPRDLAARQQTLRATIEWSYKLLAPDEQRLFRWLAVFAGGCDLEAIEAVCGEAASTSPPILDLVLALVDKNLLRAREAGGEPRFESLRTIQEYAADQLAARGELLLAQEQHACHYGKFAEQAIAARHDPDWERWLERLDREHDNMRAALDRSLAQDRLTTAYRIGAATWRFWAARGNFSEGRRWLSRILAAEGDAPTHLRAEVLNGAGGLAILQDDFETAGMLLNRCLELRKEVGDVAGIAATSHNLAQLAVRRGDFDAALVHIRETLALDQEAGDQPGTASDLLVIGWIMMLQEEYGAAVEMISQSLGIYESLADAAQIARCHQMLGEAATGLGNIEVAHEHLTRARAGFLAVGAAADITSVDHNLGQVALRQGRLQEAHERFVTSLEGKSQMNDKLGVVVALEGLACLAAARSEMSKAAQLWGACESLRLTIHIPRPANEQSFCDKYIKMARAHLRDTAFSAAQKTGAGMDMEHAIRYALAPSSKTESGRQRKSARVPYPAGLTPREVEVLALVAQGLSDGEVAQRLVLSPRTVNAHLTSIYNKLGVNSRVAATRFAVEQKLV